MANIITTHAPFLQSRAQVLVLPMSTDGNILHPTIARTKTMFAASYDDYRKKSMTGELVLGDCLLHKLPKEHTGLSVDSSVVTHVAYLLVQEFAQHHVSARILTQSLKALKPQIYTLMRYDGVRRLAFLAASLLHADSTLSAEDVVATWSLVFLDMPKITLELHFAKSTGLP